MTDKRMAIVPREADAVMTIAAVDRPCPPDDDPMYCGIYRAMLSAAPNGGKVSPYALTCAAEKLCEARLCAGAWGKANETERNAFLFEARAVIAALGLEIEE